VQSDIAASACVQPFSGTAIEARLQEAGQLFCVNRVLMATGELTVDAQNRSSRRREMYVRRSALAGCANEFLNAHCAE
jgi:hypothetical protein